MARSAPRHVDAGAGGHWAHELSAGAPRPPCVAHNGADDWVGVASRGGPWRAAATPIGIGATGCCDSFEGGQKVVAECAAAASPLQYFLRNCVKSSCTTSTEEADGLPCNDGRYVTRTFHWKPEDFPLEVATYMQCDEPWQPSERSQELEGVRAIAALHAIQIQAAACEAGRVPSRKLAQVGADAVVDEMMDEDSTAEHRAVPPSLFEPVPREPRARGATPRLAPLPPPPSSSNGVVRRGRPIDESPGGCLPEQAPWDFDAFDRASTSASSPSSPTAALRAEAGAAEADVEPAAAGAQASALAMHGAVQASAPTAGAPVASGAAGQASPDWARALVAQVEAQAAEIQRLREALALAGFGPAGAAPKATPAVTAAAAAEELGESEDIEA